MNLKNQHRRAINVVADLGGSIELRATEPPATLYMVSMLGQRRRLRERLGLIRRSPSTVRVAHPEANETESSNFST